MQTITQAGGPVAQCGKWHLGKRWSAAQQYLQILL